MAKLIYKLTESASLQYYKEANEITFDIDDGLTIDEFKIVCMRMAAAMGYSPKSITSSFGEINDKTHNIGDLLKILNER